MKLHKLRVKSRYVVFFLFIIGAVLIFASCSFKSEHKAFTSQMDSIDAFIAQGDISYALKVLAKSEKKTFDALSFISIFRRYKQLEEYEKAEKILKRGLKKFPNDEKLLAVYAHFLLRSGRKGEAVELAKLLVDTRYSSLFAEIVIEDALVSDIDYDFTEESFLPIFKSAYQVTKNSAWIKNSAILLLLNNNLKDAAALQPNNIYTVEDALFWALVQYDNFRFLSSLDNLEIAKNLLSLALKKDVKMELEISALIADSLVQATDFDKAEQERQHFLKIYNDSVKSENFFEPLFFAKYLPVIYTNSAFYASLENNQKEQYRFLLNVVSEFPEYLNGLFSYANFAYKTSLPREESFYASSLRSSGLKTVQMENYDSLPRASVADALFRIEQAIKKTEDANSVANLVILQKDLQYKLENISDSEKIADVWTLLESTSNGTSDYPSAILQYALYTLLSTQKNIEAENLFEKYMKNKYEFLQGDNFFGKLLSLKNTFEDWECDYAAFFALQNKYLTVAIELYEYLLANSNKYKPASFSHLGYSATVNLAMIYSSTGEKQKAIDLYSSKIGSLFDKSDKSEILYRIGCIQNSMNNTSEALKTLDFSVHLNPLNEKAQFLLLQLRHLR